MRHVYLKKDYNTLTKEQETQLRKFGFLRIGNTIFLRIHTLTSLLVAEINKNPNDIIFIGSKYIYILRNNTNSIGKIEKHKTYIIRDKRKKPKRSLKSLTSFNRNNVAFLKDSAILPQQNENFAPRPAEYISPSLVKVKDVLLSEININLDLFQNRDSEFSQESVEKIKQAVAEGKFHFEVFNPVLLWNDKGKLYVLSGHSRTEAFKQLNKEGVIYEGQNFSKIPATIINTSFDEAKRIALDSNTFATTELPLERAKRYRDLREQGASNKTIFELANKTEGKEAKAIVMLSYLNPNGVVIDALKDLDKSDPQNKNTLIIIADWTGAARYHFSELSDLHEKEIFNYLMEGGYKGDFKNKNELIERLNVLINKAKYLNTFAPDKLLNVRNAKLVSESEKSYNLQLENLKESLKNAKINRDIKIREFSARKEKAKKEGEVINEAIIDEALRKLNNEVLYWQGKIIELTNRQGQYFDADKQQAKLFGFKKNIVGFNDNAIY